MKTIYSDIGDDVHCLEKIVLTDDSLSLVAEAKNKVDELSRQKHWIPKIIIPLEGYKKKIWMSVSPEKIELKMDKENSHYFYDSYYQTSLIDNEDVFRLHEVYFSYSFINEFLKYTCEIESRYEKERKFVISSLIEVQHVKALPDCLRRNVKKIEPPSAQDYYKRFIEAIEKLRGNQSLTDFLRQRDREEGFY